MDDAVHVPGYMLEQQLGSGEYGVVFAAREESSGQLVAVKVLPVGSPSARPQAVREAALLGSIDHPHLVPVYGAVEVADGVALIMELADGGNLAGLLAARGALSPGEVVTIFAPIAQGLAEAHRRGVVHGDLRPANVLFTGDGRPMLADLGVGRLLGEHRPSPEPGFAAPELAGGRPATPGSDLYGLAALTIVALTGQLPGVPPVLPGLPPATYGALSSALQPDPGRRPDAESFANAMFALADPEPVVLDVVPTAASESAALVRDQSTDEHPTVDYERASRRARDDRSGRRGRRSLGRADMSAEEVPVSARSEPDEHPVARTGRRRPRRRDVLTVVAIVLTLPVIALGVVFVVNQVRGVDPSDLPLAGRATSTEEADESTELCGGPQPAPTEQPPEVSDWTNVVEHLYDQRAAAYAELDSELLCEVYSPTHPRLARDFDVLQAYAEEGVMAVGLQFEVVTAELVSQESGLVVLEVTDRVSPYQLVDAEGLVVADREGVPEATWEMELVPAADASGWRIG
ncbi:MAG: protein kinase [Streptosporangiales bacterium]|nr:protein kinase [Streptosporangiales bacterium]